MHQISQTFEETMDKADTEYVSKRVIKMLKRQNTRDEIAFFVANTTGWHWDEASAYVDRLAKKHQDDLARSHSMLTIPLSVIFIVGGLLLFISMLLILIGPFLVRHGYFGITGDTSQDYFISSYLQALVIRPDMLWPVLGAGLTGFGLVCGGVIGLWQQLKEL